MIRWFTVFVCFCLLPKSLITINVNIWFVICLHGTVFLKQTIKFQRKNIIQNFKILVSKTVNLQLVYGTVKYNVINEIVLKCIKGSIRYFRFFKKIYEANLLLVSCRFVIFWITIWLLIQKDCICIFSWKIESVDSSNRSRNPK